MERANASQTAPYHQTACRAASGNERLHSSRIHPFPPEFQARHPPQRKPDGPPLPDSLPSRECNERLHCSRLPSLPTRSPSSTSATQARRPPHYQTACRAASGNERLHCSRLPSLSTRIRNSTLAATQARQPLTTRQLAEPRVETSGYTAREFHPFPPESEARHPPQRKPHGPLLPDSLLSRECNERLHCSRFMATFWRGGER